MCSSDLNSTPWCFVSDASKPEIVFTVTNLGELYRSLDGGQSWTKLKREFGEVRALAIGPASART